MPTPEELDAVLSAIEAQRDAARVRVRAALPPTRVLALDGGGFRGLFQAYVLKSFETALSAHLKRDIHLEDVFDLVAGTSTGGIIACGLVTPAGRLGRGSRRTDSLIQLYENRGSTIFPRDGLLGALRQWTVGRYSALPLEQLLREWLGESARLTQARRRLLVPAYSRSYNRTWWFDSDQSRAQLTNQWQWSGKVAARPELLDPPLWRVARATSAAPTYFGSAELEGADLGRWFDGGVGANNPAPKAMGEALQGLTDRRQQLGSIEREVANDVDPKIIVVSISTGSTAPEPPPPGIEGILPWSREVPRLFAHSSGTAATELAEVLSRFREFNSKQRQTPLFRYHRIEPESELRLPLNDSSERARKLLREAATEATKLDRSASSEFTSAVAAVAATL